MAQLTKLLAITLIYCSLAWAQDSFEGIDFDVDPHTELDGLAQMGQMATPPVIHKKAEKVDAKFEEKLIRELKPFITSTYSKDMWDRIYKGISQRIAARRSGKTNYEVTQQEEASPRRVRRSVQHDVLHHGDGKQNDYGHGGYGGHHGGNHNGHGGHYSTAKWHGGEKWNGGNYDQGHGKHGYHGNYGDQNHGNHHGNYKKGLQDHYKTNGERMKTYSYGGHGWYKEMSHGHQHGQGGQAAQHGGQQAAKQHGQFYRQWQPYWKDQGKTGGHQEHYGYH